MSTQTQHTPLPWHAWQGEFIRGGGDDICRVDTKEADAEFIVRACNSHYELIEELRNLIGYADHLATASGSVIAKEAAARARAALAKAGAQ